MTVMDNKTLDFFNMSPKEVIKYCKKELKKPDISSGRKQNLIKMEMWAMLCTKKNIRQFDKLMDIHP